MSYFYVLLSYSGIIRIVGENKNLNKNFLADRNAGMTWVCKLSHGLKEVYCKHIGWIQDDTA